MLNALGLLLMILDFFVVVLKRKLHIRAMEVKKRSNILQIILQY